MIFISAGCYYHGEWAFTLTLMHPESTAMPCTPCKLGHKKFKQHTIFVSASCCGHKEWVSILILVHHESAAMKNVNNA